MIQPGDVISDRYKVIQQLGDGGFADVFEIIDDHGNIHKVMKVLDPSGFIDDYRRTTAINLLKREFRVLNQLNHPGIPRVDEDGYICFQDPHPFSNSPNILHSIVMEKIEGENLCQWLLQNPRGLEEVKAINWLKQLTKILHLIHQNDLLHRDIKPDNIMLKSSNELVLIDFGAVKELKQIDLQRTQQNTIIGTSGYASPEQVSGRNLTAKSDFFSLGRTWVHLLTGQSPSTIRKDNQDNLDWRDKAPEVSEKFKDLIDWLMKHEQKQRPENAQEILKALDDLEKRTKRCIPSYIVWMSFGLNIILLTLLSFDSDLNNGLKVLFAVVVAVLGFYLILSERF